MPDHAEASEAEDDIHHLEGAVAQCMYLQYGLNLEHRDAAWGGEATVRGLCNHPLPHPRPPMHPPSARSPALTVNHLLMPSNGRST